MTSKRTHVASPGPARRIAHGLLVACCLAWLLPAHAFAAEVTPFQATVPLAGASEGDRTTAFGEALKVAVVRASGRAEAATTPRVLAAAADPSGYVQQYSTTADRMLKVGFDARAMEQLLQQAGLPTWPSERPAVTVFLFTSAVAGGTRAITVADRVPERLEVERAAQLRGVPVNWPTGMLDPATARARLGAERAALLGLGAGGSYEWVYAHAGQTSRGQGSAAQGVDLAANALAARYAPASTRSVSAVQLRVGGLAGVRDYAALTEYLADLSLVRDVEVRQFQRDSVQFELDVRGDADLLRRIFALDGRLVPASEAPAGAAGTVDYVWQSS
ncbi:MAG TPA: DUF2066 domain-containing protein [Steroidobacteraceae bacterium]